MFQSSKSESSHKYNVAQGDQKVSVHLTITVQKNTQKYSILNSFNTYHDNVVRIRDNRWR